MEDQVLGLLTQLVEGQKETNERLDRMETRMDRIETRMDRMETRMDHMETRMDNMETHMDRIETRMDNMETRMDRIETHMVSMDQRIDKLEDHMVSMDQHMETIEQRVTKTEVLVENCVLPQLKLLAEGHTALSERLDQMDEKYASKEDVEILQMVVRRHTEEIREIKAAM